MVKIIIKIKEEYYKLVPRPTKAEYEALKESIKLNGQKDPIVINRDGFILDGYTRYEICQELGIDVKYRIQEFVTKEEELQYVVESNVNRRQLNPFQKIETFMYLLEMFKKRAEENSRSSHYHVKAHYACGGSVLQYSKSLGLGTRRVQDALYIIKHGTDDVIEKCRNGKISINQAYTLIREEKLNSPFIRKRYIKNDTKLICPHCQRISKKKEWKIA